MSKFLAIIIASLITTSPLHAAGDQCYSINNPDAKNFCLATARNEANYCYSISNQDQKNMCLAV
eukprot:gene50144-67144_t